MNNNQIELNDEQLSQVVGGCGRSEEHYDDGCGGEGWGNQRGRRHRGHHHHNNGWGYDSYESDYSERHYHRSSC